MDLHVELLQPHDLGNGRRVLQCGPRTFGGLPAANRRLTGYHTYCRQFTDEAEKGLSAGHAFQ